MKHQRFKLATFLPLLLGCVMTYGQETLEPTPKKAGTLDDYKPRSMKEVSVLEENIGPGEKVIVRGDILPSRVKLRYLSRGRPLPQMKKDVLYRWAQLYAGSPEHYTRPK